MGTVEILLASQNIQVPHLIVLRFVNVFFFALEIDLLKSRASGDVFIKVTLMPKGFFFFLLMLN